MCDLDVCEMQRLLLSWVVIASHSKQLDVVLHETSLTLHHTTTIMLFHLLNAALFIELGECFILSSTMPQKFMCCRLPILFSYSFWSNLEDFPPPPLPAPPNQPISRTPKWNNLPTFPFRLLCRILSDQTTIQQKCVSTPLGNKLTFSSPTFLSSSLPLSTFHYNLRQIALPPALPTMH